MNTSGSTGLIAGMLGLVVAVMVIAKLFKPLVMSVSTDVPYQVDAATGLVKGAAASNGPAFCEKGTELATLVSGNVWVIPGAYCTNLADSTVGSLMLIIPVVLVAIVLVAIVGYLKSR